MVRARICEHLSFCLFKQHQTYGRTEFVTLQLFSENVTL